jgi:prepilin-type N-terminal cleavage/methylation domain-containing protein
MKKAFTLFETLTVLALISILVGFAIGAGKSTTDKALELKAQYSTLLQKASEEAYKHITSNTTEDQSYEVDGYTVDIASCGNGFTLEIYDQDLDFTEDTENCEEKNIIEIATFDACNTMKSQIKKVCKLS